MVSQFPLLPLSVGSIANYDNARRLYSMDSNNLFEANEPHMSGSPSQNS